MAKAGADIVLCARNFDRCRETCSEIEKFGVKTLAIRCDVSNVLDVDNLIEATLKKFGRIDILVNNAAIFVGGKHVVDMDDEDWDRTLAVALRGSFLCCRAAARGMIKQGEGKIINVASAASFKAIAGMSAYSAAKAGLIMLTKTLALELAKHNIQVNALSPGYLLTNFNRDFFETEAGKKLISSWPRRRIGNPGELKGAIVFLASSASNYMTGSEIIIEDGQTL